MDIRRALTLLETSGREDDRDEFFRIQSDLQDRLEGDDHPDFEVISHREQRHKPERPLVIVVHPGDALENPEGWDYDDYKKVKRWSLKNQAEMADELSTWRRTHDADIVILHRASSIEIGDGGHSYEEYEYEVSNGHSRGSVLFGDDLAQAAKWIIANLHIADRPHVFLTGAYAEPDHGCLTYIGKAVEAIIGPDRMSVSKFSPPGSGPGKVWRPGNRIVRHGKE